MKNSLYVGPKVEEVEIAYCHLICGSKSGDGNDPIYVDDLGDGGFQ